MDLWTGGGGQVKDRGQKGTEGGFFCPGGLSPVWVIEDGLLEFSG